MATLKRTIKHDVIKGWAEKRGGVPARVHTTTDALKIKIGSDETTYEPISWDDWFSVFDEKEFAFVCEDPGYASKVVKRNGKEDGAAG
ncbi:MAG: hypothetical protein WCJ30_12270 [Deltaproteobacteria bacterium]